MNKCPLCGGVSDQIISLHDGSFKKLCYTHVLQIKCCNEDSSENMVTQEKMWCHIYSWKIKYGMLLWGVQNYITLWYVSHLNDLVFKMGGQTTFVCPPIQTLFHVLDIAPSIQNIIWPQGDRNTSSQTVIHTNTYFKYSSNSYLRAESLIEKQWM